MPCASDVGITELLKLIQFKNFMPMYSMPEIKCNTLHYMVNSDITVNDMDLKLVQLKKINNVKHVTA